MLAPILLGALAFLEAGGIEIFWCDYALLERSLPPGARAEADQELLSIFGEAGIPVQLYRGSPEENGRSGPFAIRVILIPRSGGGWELSGDAMGATVRDTRTAYVFLPVLRAMLGQDVDRSNKLFQDPRRSRLFARALARIVAHEVAHAIDPELPHGPEGTVMDERWTAESLRRPRLSFAGATAERLPERITGQ